MSLINPPVQHDLLSNTQLFQFDCVHQIDKYGSIVGEVRIDSTGQVVTAPPPTTISQRTISGGSITIDSTSAGKALSASDFLCQAVQITSIRSDWTANTGTIGIGNLATWYSAMGPMGAQTIEAPSGGVLNLKNVIIYGSNLGDQVKFLVLNSI